MTGQEAGDHCPAAASGPRLCHRRPLWTEAERLTGVAPPAQVARP